MKWSLNELRRVGGEPLRFDETVDLTARLKERRPDLIDAGEVHVHGIFTNDRFGIVDYCQVETVLTLPSTRSFTPVKLKLKFDFSEHYLDKYQKNEIDDFDDTDAVVIVLDKDYIDLTKAVVDNILVQIPMQVLTAAEAAGTAKLDSGQGWEVEVEGQADKKKTSEKKVDPRLAKLKDFFKKSED